MFGCCTLTERPQNRQNCLATSIEKRVHTVTISQYEQKQVQAANDSGRTPVVFVHGLWLLAGSWDRWIELFDDAGFGAIAPQWPDDPESVAEANAHPDVFAHKSVGDVADHMGEVITTLNQKPVVIGHSFGGLLTQIIAGRGLSRTSVAIDPGPFRGVLPLPLSALKAASPVIANPLNRGRAVPLTLDQFRFAFANAVSEDEAKDLYEGYAVPGSGVPLFQAAFANINPWTEAKVNWRNPDRGPLLIIDGEKDNTLPLSMARAAYRRQKKNAGITEFVAIPNRGHSLVIDSGWREVADIALRFVRRFES
jgi:pimeloyl-ACP methyl ester carboxylesterase